MVNIYSNSTIVTLEWRYLNWEKGNSLPRAHTIFGKQNVAVNLAAQRNPIKSTINQSNRLLKIFCSVSTDFHYFQTLQKIRSKTSVVKFFSSKALAQTFKLALKILLNRARLQMFSRKFSETLRTVVKNTCYIPLTTWWYFFLFFRGLYLKKRRFITFKTKFQLNQ